MSWAYTFLGQNMTSDIFAYSDNAIGVLGPLIPPTQSEFHTVRVKEKGLVRYAIAKFCADTRPDLANWHVWTWLARCCAIVSTHLRMQGPTSIWFKLRVGRAMKIPVSSDLHAFCLFFDSYYLSRTPWCEVFIGRSLGKTKWQKLFEKCCLTRTKPKADVERSRFNVLVATGPHWTWADYLQTMGLKSGNKNLNLSHHVECAHVGNFQPFINFWFNHVPGWKHHMFECFCGGFFFQLQLWSFMDRILGACMQTIYIMCFLPACFISLFKLGFLPTKRAYILVEDQRIKHWPHASVYGLFATLHQVQPGHVLREMWIHIPYMEQMGMIDWTTNLALSAG